MRPGERCAWWGFLCVLVLLPLAASGGAFLFADSANGINVIAHPAGYDGGGGSITMSLCIDPASPHANEMEVSAQNAVATWNARLVTTGNLVSGAANELPSGTLDFASVLLHEVGHCLGLAHPNLASESGLPLPEQDGTRSTPGGTGNFEVGAGGDGNYGSSDDQRGDDRNLHWFQIGVNDPFQFSGTVDSSTWSRRLADLPAGDAYAANADRSVAASLGHPSTEAVMQQGTSFDEAQRTLVADDVATLLYAMTGLDETYGSADDYTLNLTYAGLTTNCDVPIAFDDDRTDFAACSTTGQFISDPPPGPPIATHHVEITTAEILFNGTWNWFFLAQCGDGTIGGAETCDDGAAVPGDGCDAQCIIEPGWQCSGEPSSCATVCGDGVVGGSEECDDGATTAGDGCDGTCTIEPGWECSGAPSFCDGSCGDGLILGTETCDDGGTAPGDGCGAACSIEAGWQCSGEPSSCGGTCGDGGVVGAEECDDGDTTPGDGCDESCSIEPGWLCSGAPSNCTATPVPAGSMLRWLLAACILALGVPSMLRR